MRENRADRNEPVGVRERKFRPERDGVQDGEAGRGGADAEREVRTTMSEKSPRWQASCRLATRNSWRNVSMGCDGQQPVPPLFAHSPDSRIAARHWMTASGKGVRARTLGLSTAIENRGASH